MGPACAKTCRHTKRFIEGEGRTQITLLPECLDDYVAQDNPVRVVEVQIRVRLLDSSAFGPTPAGATRSRLWKLFPLQRREPSVSPDESRGLNKERL